VSAADAPCLSVTTGDHLGWRECWYGGRIDAERPVCGLVRGDGAVGRRGCWDGGRGTGAVAVGGPTLEVDMESGGHLRVSDSGDEGNGNMSAGASVANKSKNLSIADLVRCRRSAMEGWGGTWGAAGGGVGRWRRLS